MEFQKHGITRLSDIISLAGSLASLLPVYTGTAASQQPKNSWTEAVSGARDDDRQTDGYRPPRLALLESRAYFFYIDSKSVKCFGDGPWLGDPYHASMG